MDARFCCTHRWQLLSDVFARAQLRSMVQPSQTLSVHLLFTPAHSLTPLFLWASPTLLALCCRLLCLLAGVSRQALGPGCTSLQAATGRSAQVGGERTGVPGWRQADATWEVKRAQLVEAVVCRHQHWLICMSNKQVLSTCRLRTLPGWRSILFELESSTNAPDLLNHVMQPADFCIC